MIKAIKMILDIINSRKNLIDYQYNTGSFNFTRAADSRNAENVIIIDDSVVAKQYLQNWFSRKVKNQSRLKTKSNRKQRNTNR
jgi:phospholipase D